MRSSDQRYYHVQRPKRTTEDFTVEIVKALQRARIEGDIKGLDDVLGRSASEYPVVLLACGRTANDFRRSFRRGVGGYHNIPFNNLAPLDLRVDERLDGYAAMRLSREQHANVKDKSEKLYERDRLISDPQGATWTQLIHAHMAGQREEHIDLLLNLRDRGRVLNELDRAGYQLLPFPMPDELPDNLPSNDAVLPFAARQFVTWQQRKDDIRWEAWRSGITTSVRMLSAYLDGSSMMAARYCREDEPSTHEHRRPFQARVDRIENEFGLKLDVFAAEWDGRRPEEVG